MLKRLLIKGMAQNNKNKLELTWIGKYDEHQSLEPRILIENKEYSYGNPETGTLSNGKPWNGNMLIHGDNLLALKALEQDYSGQVKCIYIDPPYNTGSAFEHYDDSIEHSIWLSLMRDRLEILYNMQRLRDGTPMAYYHRHKKAVCHRRWHTTPPRQHLMTRPLRPAASPNVL